MTLDELIEALEAATGPSRDLDGAIYVVVHGWTLTRVGKDYDGQNECEIYTPNGKLLDSFCYPTRGSISPYYHIPSTFCPTSSLDAALTLAPGGFYWIASSGRTRPDEPLGGASVHRPGSDGFTDEEWYAEAATPALALCIASLKARSAQQ